MYVSWATNAIEKLKAGETVRIRPKGQSMKDKVASGSLVTVSPVLESEIAVDDIVLCKVKGNQYLHLIKAIKGDRFLIGNNRGGINGWIGFSAIYGKATSIEK
jgi:hypothetical protein